VIELYPHQITQMMDPVRTAFIRGFKRPCLVGPTGSGKTRVFAAITEGARDKGNTVAILAHRVELIDQIDSALQDLGIHADIVASGFERRESPVMLASVHTLIRRLDRIAPPTLVIVDECHHAAGSNTWGSILTRWSASKRLGVTATPIRLDGKGLATHFDTLVLGPTVQDLVDAGYLARPRVFAPPSIDTSGLHTLAGEFIAKETEERANKPSVTGDALSHYRQHAGGRPALAFCVSVKHASDVATQFRDAGYTAVMLKGGMDRQMRREALADFKRGAIQVITSVDIFSEGVDAPGVHCGIFLRPTQSLGLWRQQVGRIMRPAPGKDFAILLDHAGNCVRHGLPTEEPAWALTYDETKRKKTASISVRVCPKCFAASSARALTCSNCGERFKESARSTVEEREGELVEVTPAMLAAKAARREQGRARTLEELKAFEKMRGFKPGWADHVYQARMAKMSGR
jgi:superfamily II DNA or RNA helicase